MTDEGAVGVAVTGMGVINAAGESPDAFWSGLSAGVSCAAAIDAFDAAGLPVTFACEAKEFDAEARLGSKSARRLDRFAQLALAAATDAVDRSTTRVGDPKRAAIVVGSGFGGIGTFFDESQRLAAGGRMNPLLITTTMPNAPAAILANELGWLGPNLMIATACASSTHAIGEAVRLLQRGEVDIALAGGAEAAINPLVIHSFAGLRALSTRNHDPGAACRPFDIDRDGFVLGEGAAFVVLEREDDARRNRWKGGVTVVGYGRNDDGFHLVMPSPDGAGARDCMSAALEDAGLEAADIDHVNAHGTSTTQNDVAEGLAITSVFGPGMAVTSTKSVVGHLIGAAGATEVVAAALSVERQAIPPTANSSRVDAACGDLDVVSSLRPAGLQHVLSNSFAFGGHNASLVLRRVPPFGEP